MPEYCTGRIQAGRPLIENFDEGEELYFRVAITKIRPNGTIEPHAIRIPDTSCDRGTLNPLPYCTLRGYSGHGLGSTLVRQIRAFRYVQEMESHKKGEKDDASLPPKIWTLSVQHRPDENNYAHSELWLYRDNERQPEKPSSNRVKLAIREAIAMGMRLICWEFPDPAPDCPCAPIEDAECLPHLSNQLKYLIFYQKCEYGESNSSLSLGKATRYHYAILAGKLLLFPCPNRPFRRGN